MDMLAFAFRSGSLPLNFVGTLAQRGSNDIERLRTPDDLARWCVEVELLQSPVVVNERQFEEAKTLREAVYRCVQAARANALCGHRDIDIINRWAKRTPLPRRLSSDGHSTEPVGTEKLTHVLADIARAAIELLTGPDIQRIRECVGPTCTVLFLDSSRRTRRWCSMNYCGNRAKKVKYRSHD